MPRLLLTFLSCQSFYTLPVSSADVSESAAGDESDVWSRTRQTADEWWERFRETVGEAQQLTIRAGGDYRQYLTEQVQQVMKARKNLENDIAAAWNTYETVRVSGELVGLVRSSRRLLDGLLNRQVPTLRTFQNLEMKREFEMLATQLRMADAS